MANEISINEKFPKARGTLVDKVFKAMLRLLDTIAKFNIDVKDSVDLFHRIDLFQPTLLYCNEIWSDFPERQLKNIQYNYEYIIDLSINSNTERPIEKFQSSKRLLFL